MYIPDILLIVGDGDSGKTYSLRNLDPTRTNIVQCSPIPKLIPWGGRGYEFNQNVFHENDFVKAYNKIKALCKEGKDIVIDDIYYTAYAKYMTLSHAADIIPDQREKTNAVFGMFREMGRLQYAMLQACFGLQSGCKGTIIMHDEQYENRIIARVVGSMAYNKSKPEEMFSVVLYSQRIFVEGEIKYVFLTRDDGITPAKSPPNMLPPIIGNDLQLVYNRLDEWKEGVPIEDSEVDFEIIEHQRFMDTISREASVLYTKGGVRGVKKQGMNLNKR